MGSRCISTMRMMRCDAPPLWASFWSAGVYLLSVLAQPSSVSQCPCAPVMDAKRRTFASNGASIITDTRCKKRGWLT